MSTLCYAPIPGCSILQTFTGNTSPQSPTQLFAAQLLVTEQLQRRIQKNVQAVFRCLTGHTPIRNLDPHRYADQVRRYAKSMYQSFVAGGYTKPISVQSCHIVPRLAGVPAAAPTALTRGQVDVQAVQAGGPAALTRGQVDAQATQAGGPAALAVQVDAQAVQATQPAMQPSAQSPSAPAQTPQPASSTLPHTFDICGRVHQGEDVFAFWALYTTTPAAEHLIMHSLRVILPPARI